MTDLNAIKRKTQGFVYLLLPKNIRPDARTAFLWLTIGCAIRFSLMPLFSHTDLMATLWVSLTFLKSHQLISTVDPPAIFAVFTIFYYIAKPFFSSTFVNFLTSGIAFTPPNSFLTFSLLQPGINSVLFLSKIPFLLFDIVSALAMLHLFDDARKGFFAFKIWLLSPVSIFVSYVFGQYDIFVVSFIIIGLYFLKKQKFGWSMLALGFAGAFKMIGLALIPLVAIYQWKISSSESSSRKAVRLLKVTTFGLLPFLAFQIVFSGFPPFYESVNAALPRGSLFNGFLGDVFYASGVVGHPLISGLVQFLVTSSISFINTIYFVPFIYVIILLGSIYAKSLSFEKVCGYFAVFLLSYYSFSLFLPQWFLWVQPFLIIFIVNNRGIFQKLYLTTIPLYFLYLWFWDAALTTNLLVPIMPKAMAWPGPITLLNNAGLPALQICGVFRTIFSAVCIFAAFWIIRNILAVSKQNPQ